MYLVDNTTVLDGLGLGDALCALHNSIANTNLDDTIYLKNSTHKDFYNKIIYPRLQIKDIYKRNFVYVDKLPSPNTKVTDVSKELLPIFESKSEDKIVFCGYPIQSLIYPFINRVKTAKGRARKRLVWQCMKRTFKQNWEDFILPFANKHGYETISYYETDIEKVFNTVANAKVVIGPEGGIYHLTVMFNKPFIMIVPDLLYECGPKLRKAAINHNLKQHSSYKHQFIQESKFFDEISMYL